MGILTSISTALKSFGGVQLAVALETEPVVDHWSYVARKRTPIPSVKARSIVDSRKKTKALSKDLSLMFASFLDPAE